MASKTVFLSAVSGEFREAREALARELRKAGCEVMEQADFHLEPANPTLLGKLRAYIETCDTVICLLGQTSGFMAPPGAEEPFLDLLPADVDREPWSYTQWEGFFAEHYHRPTIRVRAIESWLPGPPDPRQAAYLAHLGHSGADLTRSAENARHAQLIVLRAMGLIAAEGTPFNVPFASIGDLFMGREPFMARLRESFRSTNTPVAIRAVHGMGGIGKTRASIDTTSQPQEPPPRKPWLEELCNHPVLTAVSGLATFAVILVGVVSGVATMVRGPVWPVPPDIHPKDTTDGSSLILPFVVRNPSALFQIKDAYFICRIDLLLAVDAIGNRVTVRGFDFPAGTYDIPVGGTPPTNVPCDASQLLKSRPNGTLTLGDTDTVFLHKFPSGVWQPQVFIPPLKLLKTCMFIQASYQVDLVIHRYATEVVSPIFQWPEIPGSHQWAEGAVGQNITLPGDTDTGSYFGTFGKGGHPLQCSQRPLPYYAMIISGRIQLIPIVPVTPFDLTGDFGKQIIPPYL